MAFHRLRVLWFLAGAVGVAVQAQQPPAASPPSSQAFYAQSFSKVPSVPAMTDLGRRLFFDRSLSASGGTACATCHDPKFAYGPADAGVVALGGSDSKRPGFRAVPALRYSQNIPPFSEHYFDEAIDESTDQGPTGGRTWDGRASSAHDQALVPLLSPFEMANDSTGTIVSRVERASYAAQMRDVFGPDVFATRATAFKAILLSLEVFQQSPAEFYPYNSRYDDWLRGHGTLSAQEQRGLALFSDPRKGNCARCHPSQIRRGVFPQFTDFGYVALAAPRNRQIPANRDPAFFDLGLCGPERTDLADRAEFCGLFRAPTLRNSALRRGFFHNSVFHSLREVLEFYVDRDLHPAKWYGRDATGRVRPYDDLPSAYQCNVDREPPLDRKPGEPPALSSAQIDDIVAFLNTLTDSDLLPGGLKNR